MAFLGDDMDVDYLELSVRAANACQNAGIKTVGDLRKADLAKIGLGSKQSRENVADALAQWDNGRAKWAVVEAARKRLADARAAFTALTAIERAAVFREFSQCTCADIGSVVAKHPRIAIAAGIGALAGLLLGGAAVTTPAAPAATEHVRVRVPYGVFACKCGATWPCPKATP